MKLTTMLVLGAAALAIPAYAADTTATGNTALSTGTQAPQVDAHQNAGTDASTTAPAQAMTDTSKPGRSADASATVTTAANTSAAQPATNADTSSNTASNGQVAANTSAPVASNGADTSPLSSVPDTQKKYKRSARASDFKKEAETTKQLNQQVASAGGLPKVQ